MHLLQNSYFPPDTLEAIVSLDIRGVQDENRLLIDRPAPPHGAVQLLFAFGFGRQGVGYCCDAPGVTRHVQSTRSANLLTLDLRRSRNGGVHQKQVLHLTKIHHRSMGRNVISRCVAALSTHTWFCVRRKKTGTTSTVGLSKFRSEAVYRGGLLGRNQPQPAGASSPAAACARAIIDSVSRTTHTAYRCTLCSDDNMQHHQELS